MFNLVVENPLEACRLVLRSHFTAETQIAMTIEEIAAGMSSEMRINLPEVQAIDCLEKLIQLEEVEPVPLDDKRSMYRWRTRATKQ